MPRPTRKERQLRNDGFLANKQLILDLYLSQKKPYADVISLVHSTTGFIASLDAYKKQVGKWRQQADERQATINHEYSRAVQPVSTQNASNVDIRSSSTACVERAFPAPGLVTQSRPLGGLNQNDASFIGTDTRQVWSPKDIFDAFIPDVDDDGLASVIPRGTSTVFRASEEFLTAGSCAPRHLLTFKARQPLHDAASNGNLDLVRLLLDDGDFCDAEQEDGVTSLWLAAQQGRLEVVRELLQAGADRDFEQKTTGRRPLHEAAENGHSHVVEVLLQYKCDFDATTHSGISALWLAVRRGDMYSVQLLLGQNANANVAATTTSLRPVHLAARAGYVEILRSLLSKIENKTVDATTNSGETALWFAAKHGAAECARLLLDAGADTSQTLSLHVAALNGHSEILEMILDKGGNVNSLTHAGVTPLIFAAHHGDRACVKLLIKAKADVEKADSSGRRALHQAAQNGHCQILEMLLEHTQDTNVPAHNGETPLWLAAEKGDVRCIERLLAAGANTEAVNIFTRHNALHQAAQYGRSEVVRILLQHMSTTMINSKGLDGVTPLWLAASRGDPMTVQMLLDAGAHADSVDLDTGRRPLHQASRNGHSKIVELLLERTADKDIDMKCKRGFTALWLAVAKGSLACVRLLLDRGADADFVHRDTGYCLVHHAAWRGRRLILQLLLQRCTNFDLAAYGTDFDLAVCGGQTPLWLAAQHGDSACVRFLIEKGADTNAAVASSGRRPLHEAAQNGRSDVVRLLLENEKTRPNVRAHNGETPLLLASENGDIDTVRLILARDRSTNVACLDTGECALHLAAHNGHLEVVQLLIDHGAEVNSQTYAAVSPLWLAADRGHAEIVKLLLRHGANPNKPSNTGRYPLHQAAQNGHGSIAHILMNSNVNFDMLGMAGESPLWLAAQQGDVKTVHLFLSSGANVNVFESHTGLTALHMAALNGHNAVIRLLLNYVGHIPEFVNAKSHNGATPLWLAAENGNSESVSLLLKQCADPNATELNTGRKPLHQAAQKGHSNNVWLLLQSGAEVNAATADGITPLWFAAQHGDPSCVHLLLRAGAGVDQADLNTGQTALHRAAQGGRSEIVRVLCAKGASIDYADYEGLTPLDLAAMSGHSTTAKILIETKRVYRDDAAAAAGRVTELDDI